MEYKELIPETPKEQLVAYLRDEANFFKENIVAFKAIGHEDAEAAFFEENFMGDFRRSRHQWAARCWCSGCGRIFLAEYIRGKTCCGKASPSGIRTEDAYTAGTEEIADGNSLICPCCGEVAVLRSASYMQYGATEQAFVARAYVAEGCVVFVKYMVEQSIWKERVSFSANPFEAFIVDGKKVVKLRLWQRNIGGQYFRLDEWTENKRFADTLGAPWFYDRDLPDLGGTSLENSKLWEYMAQTYRKDRFYPIAYARLYLRHRNVENLITSGMGFVVGDGIKKESDTTGSYYSAHVCVPMPKLSWVNWKEARPSKMLGLTRDGMRAIQKEIWGLDEFQAYRAVSHKLSLQETIAALEVIPYYSLASLGNHAEWTGGKIMQAVRYLKKTKCDLSMLKDYWRMAARQGLDLDNPVIRWPRDLRTVHDRLQEAQRYSTTKEEREAFGKMSARCRGLNWSDGKICIRVAESPEELVQEGKTLHHCVGGYAKHHARGNIILFIRHARRPERSWFTLNLNVLDKRIIQNHGYGNERSPEGKPLHIPKSVLRFVEEWRKQVLEPWKLPPEKNTEKKPKRAGKKKKAA